MYDNEDNVCGICYNGTSYYFVKNLQGDVISLVVKTGMDEESRYVVAANYTYDAWGKCTVKDADGDVNTSSDFVGNINPYRYRGYYYDTEAGLYYLQSRYYDPEVGRFINSDSVNYLSIGNITGYNLYTYCHNAPNNFLDENGYVSLKGIEEVFSKIFSLGEKICDFLLGQYGISKRKFAKRKYKNKRSLYSFVFKNKAKIKSLSGKISSISAFLEILLTVSNSASCIKNHKSEALAIAELLFWGLVKLIGITIGKIVGWLIGKICFALFWLKFVIENLLEYLIDKFLNGKLVEKVKVNYLNSVNTSKITFANLFVALFKGIKATV